ncbi:hypothetical protein Taro_017353 [Colocasia esculenta]|uniref:Ubiquitin-like protease family profile domain-containing protein n=1 Tax=Colocasia esculenta TaxID=4460 RepID=A0A843UR70_COLES|nr:hypothetical protein [Colocasia esculenta]
MRKKKEHEEEEAERMRKEEEEDGKKRKQRQISPSSLSRRVSAEMRIRRQLELYTPEDFRYQKSTKANVSTSEPIFVDFQESTDALTTGKKEERRDYITQEVLGVAEKDDKSRKQHFDYSFRKLDRAPTEFDLLFSPMHVGMNHWALLVIHIKEKEFHVYDSLIAKDRRDIPQYVEEIKRYMKGTYIQKIGRYATPTHAHNKDWETTAQFSHANTWSV